MFIEFFRSRENEYRGRDGRDSLTNQKAPHGAFLVDAHNWSDRVEIL